MHFIIGVAIFMVLIWVALFPGFLVTYYLLPEFVRLNRYAVWLSAAGAMLIMYAGIYYFAFVQTGSVAWSWYEDKKSFFIYSFMVLLVFVSFGTLGPTPSYNSRTPGNIWDWSTGEKPYTPRYSLQTPHAANTNIVEADAPNIVDEPAPPAQEEPASPRRITNIVDVNEINADNLKKNLEGIVGGSFAVHPDDLIGRLKQIGVIPDKPNYTIGGMVGHKPNVNITIFGFPVIEIWSPDLVKKGSGDSTAYSLIFTIPSEWSPEEVKTKFMGNGVILFGNQNYTAEVGDWHGRTVILAGHDWHNYLTATNTYLPESSQVQPSAGTINNSPFPPNSEPDRLALQGWSCKSGYDQKDLECIKKIDQISSLEKEKNAHSYGVETKKLIPLNSKPDHNASQGWSCQPGFVQRDSECMQGGTTPNKGRYVYYLHVAGNKVSISDKNNNITAVINNGRYEVANAEFINDKLIRVHSVETGISKDIKFNPDTGWIPHSDGESMGRSHHHDYLEQHLSLNISGSRVYVLDKDGGVIRTIINGGHNVASAKFIDTDKIRITSEPGGRSSWTYEWKWENDVGKNAGSDANIISDARNVASYNVSTTNQLCAERRVPVGYVCLKISGKKVFIIDSNNNVFRTIDNGADDVNTAKFVPGNGVLIEGKYYPWTYKSEGVEFRLLN